MLQLEINIGWLDQYEIKGDKDALLDFLKLNPFIIFVLEKAPALIKEAFPKLEKLALTWRADPEDGSEYIVISIWTGLELDEAIDRLIEFEVEAWTRFGYIAGDKIMLDVE